MNLLLLSAGREWWLIALRGLCAIGFGIIAIAWPGLTIEALVLLFGAYAFVDGAAALAAATRSQDRMWHGVEAVLGIATGIVTLFAPGLTAVVLIAIIAAWVALVGVVRLAIALRVGRGSAWGLALSGVLSIVLGALLVAFPELGALALLWLIALNAIVFGAFFLVMGLRLRAAHPSFA